MYFFCEIEEQDSNSNHYRHDDLMFSQFEVAMGMLYSWEKCSDYHHE